MRAGEARRLLRLEARVLEVRTGRGLHLDRELRAIGDRDEPEAAERALQDERADETRRGQRDHRRAMVERPADDLRVPLRLRVEPLIEDDELLGDPAPMLVVLDLGVRPVGREHRIEGEADEERDEHRAGDGQREGLEPFTREPVHEADRDEDRDDREGRRRHGEPDLIGALMRGAEVILPHLYMPHDVLADHDRIVDQDPDRERETEERHRIEREAERPDGDEAREHRDREREPGDHGGAPRVQEEEDDEDGEDRSLDQGLLHIRDRALDAIAGVLHDIDRRPGRQRGTDLLDRREHLRRHLGRRIPLGLLDHDADGIAPIVERRRPRLRRPIAHLGELAQADRAPAALRDDQREEVLRTLQAPLEPDRALIEGAVESPDGNREVLRLQRPDDLGHADPRRRQRRRLELHRQLALDPPDHRRLGDPGDRAQRARHPRIGDPRQRRRGERARVEGELHDRLIGRIEAREDRLLHLGGELAADGGDLVTDVLRGLLQVLLEDEEDGDVGETVLRRAADAVDTGDPAHRLFDAVEHLAFHHVGRGAGIGDGDVDDRLLDVGKLVGLELPEGEEPEDDQRHHRDDGDQRSLDREIGDEHRRRLSYRARRCPTAGSRGAACRRRSRGRRPRGWCRRPRAPA